MPNVEVSFTIFVDTLHSYCEVFGLEMRFVGQAPMDDEAEWEGASCSGWDPRYLDEMTPLCYISLDYDGAFHVMTGEDETGDVLEEFTLRDVQRAVSEKKPLHAVSE